MPKYEEIKSCGLLILLKRVRFCCLFKNNVKNNLHSNKLNKKLIQSAKVISLDACIFLFKFNVEKVRQNFQIES
jgi:hypothetical protein